MKKLFLFLLVMSFAVSAWSYAGTKEAEDFYRQGNFKKALEFYKITERDASSKNIEDPYVYYNIGNCYFKLDELGYATYYYYKAYKILPRDKDIRENLQLALSLTGIDLVPKGMPTAVHRAFNYFSEKEVEGIFWVFIWLFGITFSIYLLTRSKWFRPLLIFFGILFIISGSYYGLKHKYQHVELGVVAYTVNLRSGPSERFAVSYTIPQGYLVKILDTKDDWIEIGVEKKQLKGWSEKENILII
ncbi:MAG: SH3 domain-containing protein [Elusimicrobiaceae bacterium]|jgi:tetratricopeptide (TPR) repeat protein|nr:SH3 domain-containing protein [Elusimicrobiaceae bacterium]MBT3954726.1 SH3 domain-containing protein [Elusimicrobiaceae bacterium]MBT4008318.1 SH3 domain-containing protein [Elusimicrobiaceae bacterium]MBT4402456.1 SH3 domain-containing protein [Elusimicrobiaceae bacterium]MBT4439388.1 SH3 domain-containing protein [Elusimicrobiaceae bacterium]